MVSDGHSLSLILGGLWVALFCEEWGGGNRSGRGSTGFPESLDIQAKVCKSGLVMESPRIAFFYNSRLNDCVTIEA